MDTALAVSLVSNPTSDKPDRHWFENPDAGQTKLLCCERRSAPRRPPDMPGSGAGQPGLSSVQNRSMAMYAQEADHPIKSNPLNALSMAESIS